MRVGINCLGMLGARADGGARYTRNLVSALAEFDHRNEYTIFVYQKDRWEFIGINNPRFLIVQVENPVLNNVLLRGWRKVLRTSRLSSPHALREQVEKFNLDLIFHPGSMDFTLDVPAIVCVHDLQHEYYPEMFPKTLGIRQKYYKRFVDQASHLVTVSDFSKQTILDVFRIDPDRVSVTHNYVSPRFKRLSESAKHTVRRKYQLPGQFLLYPASFLSHKNHLVLLDAFAELKKKVSPLSLVLTGNTNKNHSETSYFEVIRKIAELDLGNSVFILAGLPDQVMPAIYNLASLMVFPSRFEGFGIPVIEAMACGCPVVSAKVASLPEVGGKAAVYFDPKSKASMVKAMFWVLKDQRVRDHLIKLGFQRAAAFSQKAFANKMIDVFDNVLKASRDSKPVGAGEQLR